VKKTLYYVVLLLAAGLLMGLAGCGDDDAAIDELGIDWTGNPNGTLTVINNSAVDMVVFIGQNITLNGLLGGVRAGSTLTMDVSTKVPDFQAGGFMIIRAIRLDEFRANRSNPALARIDYSAMATYGAGKKYRAELRGTSEGQFSYIVHNRTEYGLELRENSPDGEKLGYLSPRQVRRSMFSPTSQPITIFPVYVAYNVRSQTIVTFAPTGLLDAQDVQPRSQSASITEYSFPPEDANLAALFGTIDLPFATIKVQNNATRDSSFAIGTSTRRAESNYIMVSSGQLESYEIPATKAGVALALNCGLLSNAVRVPVRFAGAPDDLPVIKNGFVYQVTLRHVSGPADQASSYTAIIEEVEEIDTSDLLRAS
jgi:hypothetical protein